MNVPGCVVLLRFLLLTRLHSDLSGCRRHAAQLALGSAGARWLLFNLELLSHPDGRVSGVSVGLAVLRPPAEATPRQYDEYYTLCAQ